jgi:hypothetical protein
VFDNDGTLWSEQPMCVQLAFALDRVKALAPQHPEWEEQEPIRSVLAGDLKGVAKGGERALLELVLATHAGMTTEEFEAVASDWLRTARHPKLGRPYTELVYQPMLELLAYLRANGFKTFIVSGGGVEFMRPSAGAPSRPSATRTGTSRCWSGPPAGPARASACSSTTTTRSGRRPTTAPRPSAGWPAGSTRRRREAGRSPA